MIKRMLMMLVLVGVVLGGLFGFKAFVGGKIKEAMASMADLPQTVSAAKAEAATGSPDRCRRQPACRARADLSLEVAGVVEEITFQSGDEGAGRARSCCGCATTTMSPSCSRSRRRAARADHLRPRRQAARRRQSARRSSTTTTVCQCQGAGSPSKRRWSTRRPCARPSRAAGLRVDLGQFLSAGTVIATLQSLDPIFVDFLLPQQSVAQLSVGQTVRVKVDAFLGREFAGKITAINPKVETASRNIQVRATLPNRDQKLLPGMFATVELETGAPQRLVTLPQAVSCNPGSWSISSTTRTRTPAASHPSRGRSSSRRAPRAAPGRHPEGRVGGRHRGDLGQVKLRNGVPLAVDNRIVPTNDAAPKPVDQ
jgi:membrane fusion protein (multidrug efflux system)